MNVPCRIGGVGGGTSSVGVVVGFGMLDLTVGTVFVRFKRGFGTTHLGDVGGVLLTGFTMIGDLVILVIFVLGCVTLPVVAVVIRYGET